MGFATNFKNDITQINDETFEDCSLAAFDYHYRMCDIYRQYCIYLHKSPANVKSLRDIPFLPIEFFKNHTIKSGKWAAEKIFKSSGTTATGRSQHFVRSLAHYHRTAMLHFEQAVTELKDLTLIAILPSYQEQGDSSLISMVDFFMGHSKPDSGYFLHADIGDVLKSAHRKLVIGVSYALLDIAETFPSEVRNVMIMETGGMKGRRKEITREELHHVLKKGFGVDEMWSEYGMTELLSQAYGKNGLFQFPPWAKCLIRDVNDPFTYLPDGKIGGINVIDLANIDTCCFVETKDLGKAKGNVFEVLGRFDNSDIRGCNLLV
jgi:hypothetical protein